MPMTNNALHDQDPSLQNGKGAKYVTCIFDPFINYVFDTIKIYSVNAYNANRLIFNQSVQVQDSVWIC